MLRDVAYYDPEMEPMTDWNDEARELPELPVKQCTTIAQHS